MGKRNSNDSFQPKFDGDVCLSETKFSGRLSYVTTRLHEVVVAFKPTRITTEKNGKTERIPAGIKDWIFNVKSHWAEEKWLYYPKGCRVRLEVRIVLESGSHLATEYTLYFKQDKKGVRAL